ncbi:class I SAM-dependent methyltransferase [Pseudanabaena sp. FACHB-2040]|uniref:class I SAM-dependent methyltransferase n=1 Tax=Pseudanabaena sp. FACHB-2040 TaxID=2692859 RepID=UPI001683FFBB|nr:class I SAM-dependent methyltransferase [Pseudanabaena sp. FACHB-2040]MBD2260985.1 class I SAM-dependent methyltransferase [Pseudanabaena sp. FACHB-2040]
MNAIAAPNLLSSLINRVLAIKPLFNLAKGRARAMMIERAESIGVPWRERVQQLRSRHTPADFASDWESELAAIRNPDLSYPDYYVNSFHAYEEGNLGWLPALEVEVAAHAVHARIWPEAGAQGDAKLRQSYHDLLKAQLPQAPKDIIDLGCGVGMSTLTLQATFPRAQLTGVDLSPYFLTVAQYRCNEGSSSDGAAGVRWHHAAAEATGLPDAAYDLASACLVFHELPQSAAKAILQEARRLLRPGGHLAIMDMNPRSEVFAQMPPFVLTLLKSTEPYLDEYFALDFEQAFIEAGFEPPVVTCNSPRHRTLVARVR